MATSKLETNATFAIRTPATTANMGTGFDVLGMALGLYNELQVQRACCRAQTSLQVFGEGADRQDGLEENLILKSYERACGKLGLEALPVTMQSLNRIPFARGLGSSSAAIVSGILAAQLIHDRPLSKEAMLELATELDGHPDNVLPCLLGGAVVSTRDREGQLMYEKLLPHRSLRAHVFIPSIEIHTQASRSELPTTYRAEDAVHNLGHLAILLQALVHGHCDHLRRAMDDRLHEPYRLPHMPVIEKIMEAARRLDHWGLALSGSGPSLLILGPEDGNYDSLLDLAKEEGVAAQMLTLQPASQGARCYQNGMEIDVWH